MIIKSLLDTDLYKFTMMQVVLHHFPGAQVEYKFKCRNQGVDLQSIIPLIESALDDLCTLQLTEDEIGYLRTLRFFKSDFVDFFRIFKLDRRYITVSPSKHESEIEISIKGPWLHTILFEVPVLAIINEVYFAYHHPDFDFTDGRLKLQNKIQSIVKPEYDGIKIADYGTRRRFSQQWHKEVVQELMSQMGEKFVGTSNVMLAKNFNIKPLGTMAHEYLQACQALGPRLRDSQSFAFEVWAREYRGDLGIALSDVYGMDAFLRDFDLYFCKLFDGARHDSGDPFNWGEKMIAHYQSNQIDPKTKTLIFSDGLTFEKAALLFSQFKDRAHLAFGVGTHLSNDVGVTPLQVVIKMVRCNGQPVAKLSDSPGKTMCEDEGYLSYLRQVFSIPQPE